MYVDFRYSNSNLKTDPTTQNSFSFAGNSRDDAILKAKQEYERYHRAISNARQMRSSHFASPSSSFHAPTGSVDHSSVHKGQETIGTISSVIRFIKDEEDGKRIAVMKEPISSR